VLGALPRDAQPAQGRAHGFVANPPRGKAVGETDFDDQRQSLPTDGFAKNPGTLVPQGLEELLGTRIEDHGRGTPRRIVKADGDRRPVSKVARSSAVSKRTNNGVCIANSLPHAQKPLLELHWVPLAPMAMD